MAEREGDGIFNDVGGRLMTNGDLFDFYQSYRDNRVLMSYKGAFSQQVIVDMGNIIRHNMEGGPVGNRVFAVFVELAQNILHYSAERDVPSASGHEVGVGVILLIEEDEQFVLASGNRIEAVHRDRIASKCDFLRGLTREELQALYSKQRRAPRDEVSKGAGIGLIDIARKTSGALSYQIYNLDETEDFLLLKSVIKKQVLSNHGRLHYRSDEDHSRG